MIAAGGYVAAMTATGARDLRNTYVDAMTRELLGPLGMKSTWPQTKEGKTILLFETAQQKYLFERLSGVR